MIFSFYFIVFVCDKDVEHVIPMTVSGLESSMYRATSNMWGPHLLPKPSKKTTIKICDAVKWQQQSQQPQRRNHATIIKAKRANKNKNKDTTTSIKENSNGNVAI